jgi:hypothetical protein
MNKDQAVKLLQDFASTDYEEQGQENPSEVWDVLTCELYFKGSSSRSKYPGGQECGDYKFSLSNFCNSPEELSGSIDAIAEEIVRVADRRELETILISDRMEDGYTDMFEWQR